MIVPALLTDTDPPVPPLPPLPPTATLTAILGFALCMTSAEAVASPPLPPPPPTLWASIPYDRVPDVTIVPGDKLLIVAAAPLPPLPPPPPIARASEIDTGTPGAPVAQEVALALPPSPPPPPTL